MVHARFSASSLALALFVLCAALGISSSASALQCRQRLVTVGDSVLHVRDVCGEPALVTQRSETRTVWQGGRVGGWAQSVTVLLDVWVYDFGPRRLMEELIIEGGTVIAMRSLGYGTVSGERRGAALERPTWRRERVVVDRRALAIRASRA